MIRLAKLVPFILVVYLLFPALGAVMLLPSTGYIIQVISDPTFLDSFKTSILTAIISTAISAIFGIPLAYTLARKKIKGKSILEAIIISPIVLPPLVTGLFLLSILGPKGPVGFIVEETGLRLTRSMIGIVLAQIAVASPFVVISAKTAFEEIDTKLEYASRLLGKSSIQTFFNVSLPLAKKGIFAGLLMCFTRSIGEFGATFMLAYYPRTLPIHLYVSFLSGGVEKAAPIAVVLWLIGLVFVVLIKLLDVIPGEEIAGTEKY